MKRKAKSNAGRPSSYRPEFAIQAVKLCKLGATDRELADFFEVTEQTVNNWKLQFPEFFESLKRGKDEADARVEQSLYHRALGFSHPDVHVSNFQGDVTLTPITKVYPPETVACIFWLKNRQPEAWRDKVEVEHSTSALADEMKAARERARLDYEPKRTN